MKIIEPSVELVIAPDYTTLLSTVEQAGRTKPICWQVMQRGFDYER